MRRLYESSRQRREHREGGSIMRGVALLRRELMREHGGERVPLAESARRLAAVCDLGRALFEEYPELDGVVIFGSLLRSKPAPRDIDLCLVIHGERIESHSEDGKAECRCRALTARFQKSALSSGILGLPLGAKVIPWYDEHPYLRLRFVERCPYLALRRPAHGADPLPGFFNWSGRAYLAEKAA